MQLDEVLLNSNGLFVTVTFTKKDCTDRVLNGRLGVKKHLKGGVSTLDPSLYVTIYDVVNEGYRAVNRATIKTVKVGGITYA